MYTKFKRTVVFRIAYLDGIIIKKSRKGITVVAGSGYLFEGGRRGGRVLVIRKENEGASWILTVLCFYTCGVGGNFRGYSLRDNSLSFSLLCTHLCVHYNAQFKRFLKK